MSRSTNPGELLDGTAQGSRTGTSLDTTAAATRRFVNLCRDRIKLLHFDRDGLVT
ncbi:MAG: hypothetical protein K1X67_20265 [Fimbriimonadaceae bacterium]|nr:hypothetical protein [Fimbriimonadaceae bacterium]